MAHCHYMANRQIIQRSERTYTRHDAVPVQVTVYRASVTVVTNVAPGTDEIEIIRCEHDHATMGAAAACQKVISDLVRIYGKSFTASDVNRHANAMRYLGHDV